MLFFSDVISVLSQTHLFLVFDPVVLVQSVQVLWTSLLQLVQLAVHVRQLPVDGVQLGLQVLVLLVVAVKLSLVVVSLLLVCNGRKFAEVGEKKKKKKRREM